jgi:hypothetical protein
MPKRWCAPAKGPRCTPEEAPQYTNYNWDNVYWHSHKYGYWNGQHGYWHVVNGKHVFVVVN